MTTTTVETRFIAIINVIQMKTLTIIKQNTAANRTLSRQKKKEHVK